MFVCVYGFSMYVYTCDCDCGSWKSAFSVTPHMLFVRDKQSSQCPTKEHTNIVKAAWQGNAFCKKRCARTQIRPKAQQAKMAPAFHSCNRWWLCLIPLVEDQLYNLMKLAKQHKGEEEGAVKEREVLSLISKTKQNSLFTFGRKNEQMFLILPPYFLIFKKIKKKL